MFNKINSAPFLLRKSSVFNIFENYIKEDKNKSLQNKFVLKNKSSDFNPLSCSYICISETSINEVNNTLVIKMNNTLKQISSNRHKIYAKIGSVIC